MRKRDELTDPASCMSRARDDEMTFVLLGRDVSAPGTIRFWARDRVQRGKNNTADAQIREALTAAVVMEKEQGGGDAPLITLHDPANPAVPDDIRAAGWDVACHNDYRQAGVPHTFWLFTRHGQAVKGEGRSDGEALNQVRRQLGLPALLGAETYRERVRILAEVERRLRVYDGLGGIGAGGAFEELRALAGWIRESDPALRHVPREVL